MKMESKSYSLPPGTQFSFNGEPIGEAIDTGIDIKLKPQESYGPIKSHITGNITMSVKVSRWSIFKLRRWYLREVYREAMSLIRKGKEVGIKDATGELK